MRLGSDKERAYRFSYALAKCCAHPLLFKGDDFEHTDIDAVRLADSP